jgi:hypothetical protein
MPWTREPGDRQARSASSQGGEIACNLQMNAGNGVDVEHLRENAPDLAKRMGADQAVRSGHLATLVQGGVAREGIS